MQQKWSAMRWKERTNQIPSNQVPSKWQLSHAWAGDAMPEPLSHPSDFPRIDAVHDGFNESGEKVFLIIAGV